MRFPLLSFYFFLSLSPSFSAEASRCLQTGETKEQIKEKVLQEAYFVGKIRIDDTVAMYENPKIINGIEYNKLNIVTILQTYKSDLSGNLKVYSRVLPKDVLRSSSPPPSFGNEGEVYERSIKKDGDVFYYYHHRCEHRPDESMMQGFREIVRSSSLYIEQYQKPCLEKGGEFVSLEYEDVFGCYYPAKDSGKNCNNNSECEGFCLPDVTEEEREAFNNICEQDPNVEEFDKFFGCYGFGEDVPTNTGACSPYVNMKGRFLSVENGKTKRINIEDGEHENFSR